MWCMSPILHWYPESYGYRRTYRQVQQAFRYAWQEVIVTSALNKKGAYMAPFLLFAFYVFDCAITRAVVRHLIEGFDKR